MTSSEPEQNPEESTRTPVLFTRSVWCLCAANAHGTPNPSYTSALSTSSYTTNVMAEAGAALTACATHPLKKPRSPSFRPISAAQCSVPRYREEPACISSAVPRCCNLDLMTFSGVQQGGGGGRQPARRGETEQHTDSLRLEAHSDGRL